MGQELRSRKSLVRPPTQPLSLILPLKGRAGRSNTRPTSKSFPLIIIGLAHEICWNGFMHRLWVPQACQIGSHNYSLPSLEGRRLWKVISLQR